MGPVVDGVDVRRALCAAVFAGGSDHDRCCPVLASMPSPVEVGCSARNAVEDDGANLGDGQVQILDGQFKSSLCRFIDSLGRRLQAETDSEQAADDVIVEPSGNAIAIVADSGGTSPL